MRILIATSIYPPDISGSAQYARSLYETWKDQGHEVAVASYTWEMAVPPGLRHLLYFFKILRKGWNAELVLVLDTWTAAVPTMAACALLNKKYVLRTSGDFLWERYIDRTGDLALFKDFYGTRLGRLSDREKLIFVATQKILKKASAVIFTTRWQKGIFESAYGLDPAKSAIVENFCAEKAGLCQPEGRVFIGGTRFIKSKNQGMLKSAFEEAEQRLADDLTGAASSAAPVTSPSIRLDTAKATYDMFTERMHRAWAVILVSVSEISPNIILDAVAAGVPFILTRENGILDKVGDAAILVDPLNKNEIAEKIVWLADPKNRASQAEKVHRISFAHSWTEIADEIINIWKKAV